MLDDLLEFDWTEADRATRDLVAGIVKRDIAPRARLLDETEEFPDHAMSVLGSAGLGGILIPAQDGGGGGTMLQYCLVVEEIASACAATAVTYMTHAHGVLPILAVGSPQQRARWLPPAAELRQLTALSLTEPDAGSDVAGIRTSACRTPGGYLLNGSKIFTTNGEKADLITVFARTDHDAHRGISIFVVETPSPGLSFGPSLKKMGIRGSNTAEIFFDDVFVPEGHRLGAEGAGFGVAMGVLGDARISTAAQATGLARGAWEKAYAYALDRTQFGSRIYDFQAIQLRLMDLLTKVCTARLMLYQLARMIDRRDRSEYSVEASMAKSYCADVAMEVTTRAVDVLGGYGYLRDYELERSMRDAKITQIFDGTNDINRIVMARQIERRRKANR